MKLLKSNNKFLDVELSIFILFFVLLIIPLLANLIRFDDFLNNFIYGIIFILLAVRIPEKPINKYIYTLVVFSLFALPIFVKALFLPFMFALVLILRSTQMFNKKIQLFNQIIIFSIFIISILNNNLIMIFTFEKLFKNDLFSNFQNHNIFVLYQIILWVYPVYMTAKHFIKEDEIQAKLNNALNLLQEYSAKIQEQSIIAERHRISNEIHDSLGHSLAIQNIQLNSSLALLNNSKYDQAKESILRTQELCSQSLKELRIFILNDKALDFSVTSFKWELIDLIVNFQNSTNMEFDYQIELERKLSPNIENAIYRVVQETLTNIIKHSQSSQVQLDLNTENDILYLIIQDDGIGFEASVVQFGNGLKGMYERISNVNGKINIKSKPNEGTLINILVPMG